jgi:hypothetical protein
MASKTDLFRGYLSRAYRTPLNGDYSTWPTLSDAEFSEKIVKELQFMNYWQIRAMCYFILDLRGKPRLARITPLVINGFIALFNRIHNDVNTDIVGLVLCCICACVGSIKKYDVRTLPEDFVDNVIYHEQIFEESHKKGRPRDHFFSLQCAHMASYFVGVYDF